MTLNAPLLTIINVLERNRGNLNASGLLTQLNDAIEEISGPYSDNIFVNQVLK